MPNAIPGIQPVLKELLQNKDTLNPNETAQVIYTEDPLLTQTLLLLKQLDGDPERHWEILMTLKNTLDSQYPEAQHLFQAVAKALFELGISLLLGDEESSEFRETLITTLLKLDARFQISELELTKREKEKLQEMEIYPEMDTTTYLQKQKIKELTERAIDEAWDNEELLPPKTIFPFF